MNVLAEVAEARVLAGTSVTIRLLSGDVLLEAIVDFDYTRCQLTDHIKFILDNNDVPLKRVHLEWAQLVYLLSPVGFEVGQPSMHMEGTLISTAHLEDYDDNTCHVCFDWA